MTLNQRYNICMHTPMGKRYGSMSIQANDNQISGFLSLLQHKEPFYGTIDENGLCEFTGKIITLMRTIAYVATGTITECSLNLSLRCGQSSFELIGCAEGKESCV